ncbi:hypothetical protein [Thalassiella azotivora]
MRFLSFRKTTDAGEIAGGILAVVAAVVLGAGAAVSASVAIVQSASQAEQDQPSAPEPLVEYGDR